LAGGFPPLFLLHRTGPYLRKKREVLTDQKEKRQERGEDRNVASRKFRVSIKRIRRGGGCESLLPMLSSNFLDDLLLVTGSSGGLVFLRKEKSTPPDFSSWSSVRRELFPKRQIESVRMRWPIAQMVASQRLRFRSRLSGISLTRRKEKRSNSKRRRKKKGRIKREGGYRRKKGLWTAS